jgi:hypothetical protein
MTNFQAAKIDTKRFPNHINLTGSDCFFVMLDNVTQRFQSGNNVLRMCLSFDDHSAAMSIQKRFEESPVIHWMCNIELERGRTMLLKPRWVYRNRNNTLCCRTHKVDDGETLPSEIINRPFNSQFEQLLSLDNVNYPSGKSELIFSWHHALMDGRGSGMLLRSILSDNIDWNTIFPATENEPSAYAHIRNMYVVKRFIQQSAKPPIGALKNWRDKMENAARKSHFFSQTFTLTETNRIDDNAAHLGARFGAGNFLLACCALAVDQIRKSKGTVGDLWVPVPYDGRKRGSKGPILTNQIAFLFYRFNPSALTSLFNCVQSIQAQMTEQLKQDMPKKYDQLLGMMRYSPLWLYRFLTTRSSKGGLSSFLFSSAGEDKWDMSTMHTHSIQKIQMIPPSTVPPGLTFSFLRNNKQLTLNILWSEHTLNEVDFAKLKEILLNYLLTEENR